MNRVLTSEIWKDVKKWAAAAGVRKAAIAYVTKDLIGFKAGDILIVDASERSIRLGQTDAPLLRRLNDTGVTIHSHLGLHSKIILLGRHAVVGSANMSGSGLIETSIVTDNPTITSGIASFIKQYSTAKSALSKNQIDALCQIEVVRKGWVNGKSKPKPKKIRRLGNSTWIIGVKELAREPTTIEQKHIDRAERDLSETHGLSDSDYSSIRWGKKSRFAKECQAGDTLIEIWNYGKDKRRLVTRRLPVLLKRKEPDWIRFYVGNTQRPSDEINWSRFKRILKASGYLRKVRPFSVQLLQTEVAEMIDRKWNRTK